MTTRKIIVILSLVFCLTGFFRLAWREARATVPSGKIQLMVIAETVPVTHGSEASG
jgi:hypothetical protein